MNVHNLSRLTLKIVVIARQEARGNSKEVFSDFTFLYTVWFYCVHLLSQCLRYRSKLKFCTICKKQTNNL
ncbi:hypothetical protein FJR39_16770 [Dolichospermum flos-aquae UHCC 0037]|uniref:Uncharacterized protein n=1 Tax=Dolichospermum flos-aquae UHCC 0037 TaxID=2590026 RepID=A0ACC7S8S1_DOLFA|nr:hypothetical protein [Dolichospermum flos-aquae UHCC 0037]